MIADRELLLELGCEELPAGWLPALTSQIGDVFGRRLQEHRLPPEAPVESFSTPRRLALRVARVPERQTDLEEVVNGPAVSVAFTADGQPTAAARGFAAKQGVDVSLLERASTPRGVYVACRRRQRGRPASEVLADVLSETLRGLSFPKAMRWDASLSDGRGEFVFGRPIRWLLYLYGGRVVPFTIGRSDAARGGLVQDVVSGAFTYGHRFLATSGRAGRAIRIHSFEEYRARLLQHFVMLDRSSRHDKIARELDAKALRLKSRVSRRIDSESLLGDVPDLVEYPSVIAGTFAPEFTERLPEEVLTATLIRHQHYFPVEGEDGRLRPAFLAVVNTEPDDERAIAQNAERVVTARLRDAMFFWEGDRRITLEGRLERLRTLQFHSKLGSYGDKTDRVERLATWIARYAIGASEETVGLVSTAARLAKGDLTTDMVREFPELQGTMGGLYAQGEGLPEEVWKSLYFHYFPVAVETSATPTASQLGAAADVWASVALADRLDTLVGLFAVGERPTGSRDPFGLRRAAQGAIRILTDFLATPASRDAATLTQMIDRARDGFADTNAKPAAWDGALSDFLTEREFHFFERRGFPIDEIRAVVPRWWATPGSASRRLVALSHARTSPGFETLATLFKRVKNITEGFEGAWTEEARSRLTEPAETALLEALDVAWPVIREALAQERFEDAMRELAALGAPIDRFFVDVLVMTDDPLVRQARLSLLAALRTTILDIADIAEIIPATES